MPQFTVNPHRTDPYKNFKFRVKWDGRTVAGVSKISPLKRTTEVTAFRDGSDLNVVHKAPGRTEYPPIVLERGITHDPAFEEWADEVWSLAASAGSESKLAEFRKDIQIELLNEAGQVALVYIVRRCWVSEYQVLPELDANGSGVAIESLTLENEGWERDRAVKEPDERSI